ncbi:MAG TPA: deoxynucleoside kinase [Gammaproteobacteria bacterium]|nr:deoxynucleoside kinase [Gammaproteobacteria bacterium]
MSNTKRNDPTYIVVEGPIGVGKTSLAKRLAESLGSGLLLEDAQENPFLERFYINPRQVALPTQLYFLFQRARQLKELRQTDLFRPTRVADFLMEKDRLFAQITLDDDEFRLYEQVYAQMALDAPAPDLVIYLQAPVETLLARITKRGMASERYIETAYLQRLTDAYTEFFYYYSAAPLLIVNAAEINPVSNDQDYAMLLEQIRNIRSGRHYFNPLPIAL